MELETVKELIKEKLQGHERFIAAAAQAERYYDTENDIEREYRLSC